MRLARFVAATAVLAALLIPTTADAASAAAPGVTVMLPVRDALAQLPVRVEDRTGYARSKFRHWIDADKDGCNTRAEVLKAEAVIAPTQGASCVLSGGEWYSPYDDRYIDGPRGLDIDHLVPLAEAWDSGASAWTAKERQRSRRRPGADRGVRGQ